MKLENIKSERHFNHRHKRMCHKRRKEGSKPHIRVMWGDQSEPVWGRKKRLICIVWELIKTRMCAQDKWLKWMKGSVLWLRIQPGFQTETETCVAPSWQLFMIINSNRVAVSSRYPESRADFWWGVRCDFHPELEDRGDCWPSHFHSFPP